MFRTAGIILFLTVVVPSMNALAQTPPTPSDDVRTRARAAYAAGQEHFRNGNFARAEEEFQDAYDEVPNPIVLKSLAECQERLGHSEAAIATLERYLTESPRASDRESVRARIAQLHAHHQERSQAAAQTTAPATTAATVPATTAATTTASTTAAPATSPSTPAATHSPVVDPFASASTPPSVATPASAAAAASDSAQAQSPASPTPARHHSDTAAWVMAGVGAAGLVTGTAFGFMTLAQQKDFNQTPTTAIANRGEAYGLIADLGFLVAIGGAASALVLYLTADHNTEAPHTDSAHLTVAPLLGHSTAGLSAQLAF